MDDTGDITLDQRYADADVWCEWAFKISNNGAGQTKENRKQRKKLTTVGASVVAAVGGGPEEPLFPALLLPPPPYKLNSRDFCANKTKQKRTKIKQRSQTMNTTLCCAPERVSQSECGVSSVTQRV